MNNTELLDYIFKKPDGSKTLESPAPHQETIQIIEHEICKLSIRDIQNLGSVFDYEPSGSLYTALCKTDKGIFCIDDQQKINMERDAGNLEVRCEVFTLSGHSDLDLMIRKMARRIMPNAGRAPFFQLSVNIRTCFDALLASSEEFVVFGQGGDRVSSKFTGDRENDARIILQVRCGRDRDTVNSYLNATDYLNQSTQLFLFQQKATKAFCDAIRKEKTNLINDLKSRRSNITDIIEQASEAVSGWFAEYEKSSTITPYTPNILPAAKTKAAAKSATAPAATMTVAVPSKRLKMTGTPSPAQTSPANTGGGGPTPVADAAVVALADELIRNTDILTALAKTMKLLTNEALVAAFYFDFIAAKNATDDIFSRISKQFGFDEQSDENKVTVP